VVGIEERQAGRQRELGTVREADGRGTPANRKQNRRMCDRAKGDDDGARRQRGNLAYEIPVAAPDFVGQRLVGRRQAFHGVADPAIDEAQAIARTDRLGPRREAFGMQGTIEQEARVVPRERAARAVCTVLSRREADDEQAVARTAERRNRQAVIVRMFGFYRIAKAREPRAEPAIRLEWRAMRPCARYRALNCASSVEPRMAVIDELPPLTVCVTTSK
jgi:hypothetical protein